MTKPTSEDISRLSRYFAATSNDEFWDISEKPLNPEDKQRVLITAFASLYHWEQVGTPENIHLALLSVARALALNDLTPSLEYAQKAYDHFHESGADWIQAFTNAILSHSLLITGDTEQAYEHYQQALHYQAKLSEADRKIFDATFDTIPVPKST